jgi:hypothetical protein
MGRGRWSFEGSVLKSEAATPLLSHRDCTKTSRLAKNLIVCGMEVCVLYRNFQGGMPAAEKAKETLLRWALGVAHGWLNAD